MPIFDGASEPPQALSRPTASRLLARPTARPTARAFAKPPAAGSASAVRPYPQAGGLHNLRIQSSARFKLKMLPDCCKATAAILLQ